MNHPETIFPSPGPWKNCAPWDQSLVPKRLGTTAIEYKLLNFRWFLFFIFWCSWFALYVVYLSDYPSISFSQLIAQLLFILLVTSLKLVIVYRCQDLNLNGKLWYNMVCAKWVPGSNTVFIYSDITSFSRHSHLLLKIFQWRIISIRHETGEWHCGAAELFDVLWLVDI